VSNDVDYIFRILQLFNYSSLLVSLMMVCVIYNIILQYYDELDRGCHKE